MSRALSKRRSGKPRPPASARTRKSAILALLDDELDDYTVADWRARNLALVDILIDLELYDESLVSRESHRAVTDLLIHVRNGAATDPQNAGHVRAQNENVIHYALAARVPPSAMTIALESGFIHDLNKAIGEPLRQDEFAVRDDRGRVTPLMTTMAQIVGLNHLGDRTRSALAQATRLPKNALSQDVARAIDLCIVHHGLGSSKFIQDLIDGSNPWWGGEFVDPESKRRKLIHPAQPPLTLESVLHDLADSTQQMQGGAAWLMKYPAGFWRASGRTLSDMLGGRDQSEDDPIPLSLRLQIEVETATCKEIIARAVASGLVDAAVAAKLVLAVGRATESSERWIDDSPDYLANASGESVYHDLARSLRISPADAVEKLRAAIAGTREADEIEPLLWQSGRRVDRDRARVLARDIESRER